LNLINTYGDLKFAIRCADVWKKLQPTSDEIAEALKYHAQRSNLSNGDTSKLTSIRNDDGCYPGGNWHLVLLRGHCRSAL